MSTDRQPWPDDPLPQLAGGAARRPVVVLDDDPTGTQTLRDVAVLTAWDAAAVARHLHDPVVFLSTNSRALDEPEATRIVRDAASAALGAGRSAQRPISLVSRSDSTLRGHYPAEVAAIAEAMSAPEARTLLAPYFGEGGRVTSDDVHYLLREGARTPVGATEFARDATFGYRSSNLRDWVAERHAAASRRTPPIVSLSLELIRLGGPAAVAEALSSLAAGGVAIANAEVDRDIEVVALGALLAEEAGLPLVARTAASYVRARAGRAPAPLLAPGELPVGPAGLIVVGSHVPTTTAQLERLLAGPLAQRIDAVVLPVAPLLAGDPRPVADGARRLGDALDRGRIGLVATERVRRDVGLEGGRAVSSALVAVVERVTARPDWVLAKGGITSSDVAARALRLREARVAGQLLGGVPVWIGASDSRWPGVPLVVFPGNVGDVDALEAATAAMAGISG